MFKPKYVFYVLLLSMFLICPYTASAMSRDEATKEARAAIAINGIDLSKFNNPIVEKHLGVEGEIWDFTWPLRSPPRPNIHQQFHVLVNGKTHHVLICPLGYFIYGWHPGEYMLEPPSEVVSLIAQGRYAIEIESNDLDGDGLSDYLVVTEDDQGDDRSVEAFLRKPDGHFILAGKNDHLIPCLTCGGTQADAFDGIEASFKKFTVFISSGDASVHLSCSVTFNYVDARHEWDVSSEAGDHLMRPANENHQTQTFSEYEGSC